MTNIISRGEGPNRETMGNKVNESIRNQVYRRVVELINIANAQYSRRMPVPEIQYDLRGTTAGQLVILPGVNSLLRYTIRLNSKMLMHHTEAFIQEVVPHEVAHLVVDWIYKRRVKPHGVEWREVMVHCFKSAPNRCHDLPVEPARKHQRKYPYLCRCEKHFFTERRHRLAIKGSRYVCRACGHMLVFHSDG